MRTMAPTCLDAQSTIGARSPWSGCSRGSMVFFEVQHGVVGVGGEREHGGVGPVGEGQHEGAQVGGVGGGDGFGCGRGADLAPADGGGGRA